MTLNRFALLAAPPEVPWETDDHGEHNVYVPDVCGQFAWSILHKWAEAVHDDMCPHCGEFAIAAARALHDTVNIKLGREPLFPDNLMMFSQIISNAAADANISQVAALRLAVPDDSGSRCRDLATGQWIPSEECGEIPEAEGSSFTFAIGQNGLTRYELRFDVEEARELIASSDPFTFEPNPDYPQELQPRDRSRAANKLQVEGIAANIDPDALLTDFRTLDRGAPIVGPDNVVESGNGRVMALILASEQFPEGYQQYRAALWEIAPLYAMDRERINQLDTPILVRRRLSEVDRRAFVEEANAPATLTPSAIEQARSDAQKITLGMLAELDVADNQSLGDALRGARNRSFVRRFLEKLPANEQARLVDADGVLNMDGLRRVVAAVFVQAFPGEAGLQLAQTAFESIDEDIRTAINGISRALGLLAKAEALTSQGARDAELAIGGDLAAAVNVYAKIKRTPSLTVLTYLDQQQLFSRELTPFQEHILAALEELKRSARRVGAVFSAYASAVIAQPPPEQTSLFGDIARITKEELWELSLSQDVLVPASQADPRRLVDWCNVPEDMQEALWSWRPFRDTAAEAIGAEAYVKMCVAGFLGEEFQLAIHSPREDVRDQLRKAVERRMGSQAHQVAEFGTDRIVFELKLPGPEPEDLIFDPQEAIKAPREPEGAQPRLINRAEPELQEAEVRALIESMGLVELLP